MVLVGIIVMAAGIWVPASTLWERLPKSQAADLRRWFVFWTIKGLVVPVLVWLVLNSGFSEMVPPLMTQIRAAGSGWPTVKAFLNVAAAGFCVIGSYWAAVTLAWLLHVLERQSMDKVEFRSTLLGWSIILVPVAGVIILLLGAKAAGVACVFWLGPMVQTVIPLAFQERIAPTYTRAVIKMQGDKYHEAEAAVIEQLEQSEDDFNGWMMLAELYASHFDDLAGAERVLRETCAQPTTNASQVCVAFNRLADWHLNLAADPDAARSDLEEICRRYPDTHMAHMARMRIGQLPANRAELIAGRTPKTIRLPALGSNLENSAALPALPADLKVAAARANECVEKLKKDPDDTPVREELARLLAERLNNVQDAMEQLELLLNMPDVTPEQAAGWMGLMAAWQIKYLGDEQKGRATMERLIRLYPRSIQAFVAQRRVNQMDLEAKVRATRAANPAGEKRISLPISF